MGEEVAATVFSRSDRQRFRAKVHTCLDVLAMMLSERQFDHDRPMIGMELELNLVDAGGQPAMRNGDVLAAIANPDFQTELGAFNVEVNIPPRRLAAGAFTQTENAVRSALNDADARAREVGAEMVMIGILPTLTPAQLTRESLSTNSRYALLDQQILAARGEDLTIRIDGVERLSTHADSIAPEAACTSAQLHLQVSPDDFATYWNAAQCLAAAQVAVAANSPYFLGKQLWTETRIALFQQATDTRAEELAAQGVRPRVWFGERWITTVFDLFEENTRYFPALLPVCQDEDPRTVFAAGATPQLHELRLHNGTVYRWNRPIYAVSDNRPHLRIENRVLPSGPTVVDTCANAAFWFGAVRSLAEAERPVWSQMSFDAAQANFEAAARYGIEARLYWPGLGEVPVSELMLRRLLPAARQGLAAWGVDEKESDRMLGILEGRCVEGRNGATWQTAMVARLEFQQGLSREAALAAMLHQYREHMHSNEPVHTWPSG